MAIERHSGVQSRVISGMSGNREALRSAIKGHQWPSILCTAGRRRAGRSCNEGRNQHAISLPQVEGEQAGHAIEDATSGRDAQKGEGLLDWAGHVISEQSRVDLELERARDEGAHAEI